MSKLTGNIEIVQVNADAKKDYVFDLHVAQKLNANNLNNLAASLTQHFKQSQVNEFKVTSTDINGTTLHDTQLISVTKVDLIYTATTTYLKVFSAALCYDSAGVLLPTAIKVSFPLIGLVEDRTQIIVTFIAPITQDYRIVLM